MSDWSAKMTKIEEISRKKDELNNDFKEQTKEALEAKMEHYEEKRDAIITDMKEKLKVYREIFSSFEYFYTNFHSRKNAGSFAGNRKDAKFFGTAKNHRSNGH